MKKYMISDSYFYTKTRDKVGGTIRTDVFQEDELFKAYSYYWQDEDEETPGYAESSDEELAVKLSRRSLRKEWKAYQERKAAGITEEQGSFVLYSPSGEIIDFKIT